MGDFAARIDCCLSVVAGLEQALNSKLVEPMVVTVDQPGIAQPVAVLGSPIRFGADEAAGGSLGPAPALGTDEGFATELAG